MIYSNLYLNRKNNWFYYLSIIFSVIILMFVFSIRFFSKNLIPSQASKKFVKRLEIVNLSFNQAGIYWLSDKKEKGWIIFGETKNDLKNIVFDERDTSGLKNSYLNHYVLLRNLEPDKEYFFKIISDNQLIDNNGQPFSFKTIPKQSSETRFSPAYGRVIDKNGKLLTNGVVILNFKDAYPLLSLIKISGEWMIPLNNIIDKENKNIKTEIKDEVVNLEIYDEEENKTTIEAKSELISPLPQSIIIGKNYRFLEKEEVLGLITKNNQENLITIIYPKENSIISGAKPIIKGLALPNNNVYVNIISKNIDSYRTKTDNLGNWKIVLEKNLLPGNYLLEVKTLNKEKKEVVLNRKFQIAKSGETVLGEATKSASLTPTPTSEPLPTQMPTQRPQTPTEILTPSPTIQSAGFNPLFTLLTASSFIIIGLGFLLVF